MKLRRNRFVPTWRIKNIHVENRNYPRGYSVLESQLIRARHPKAVSYTHLTLPTIA